MQDTIFPLTLAILINLSLNMTNFKSPLKIASQSFTQVLSPLSKTPGAKFSELLKGTDGEDQLTPLVTSQMITSDLTAGH